MGDDGDDDKSLWFVVRDGERRGAACTARFGDGGRPRRWLGVSAAAGGSAASGARCCSTFPRASERGITRATLGVDSENPTGATRLYESVGMQVESDT